MCYRLPFSISDLHGNILSWVTFRNEERGASEKHMLDSRSHNIMLGFSRVKADCPSTLSRVIPSSL